MYVAYNMLLLQVWKDNIENSKIYSTAEIIVQTC